MVSVVIPCYNASLYINKCVEALSNQTFHGIKVIFVDDKSTDDTYQQLCKLQSTSDLDITVLQNAENSGPAVSRNKGIMAATTKYITFCDCDDWYDTDFIEKMVCLLETNTADIVFCGYKVADDRGNVLFRPVYSKSGEITREEAFMLDADSLCMLMVKTDIMKTTLLPNLRNGEDVATVPLLMAKSSKYAVTDKCLYNYFRRQGSASETPTMKVVDSLLSSYKFIYNHFPKEYDTELEFLGIKNVLYSAIITLFSIQYNNKRASEIIDSFENIFPDWRKNTYAHNLRMYKKIVVGLVSLRFYFAIRLVAMLRTRLLK